MKIEIKLPDDFKEAYQQYEVNLKGYEIHLKDMTATELDNMRILLQTIFKYGQVENSGQLASELSMQAVTDKLITALQ